MSTNEYSYVTTALNAEGVRELMAASRQPYERLPADLCPPMRAPSWFDPASYVAGYTSSAP